MDFLCWLFENEICGRMLWNRTIGECQKPEKYKDIAFDFAVRADLSRITLKDGTAKLRSFFQSVTSDPSLAEVVLFDIAGNRFGIMLGLVWLAVLKSHRLLCPVR